MIYLNAFFSFCKYLIFFFFYPSHHFSVQGTVTWSLLQQPYFILVFFSYIFHHNVHLSLFHIHLVLYVSHCSIFYMLNFFIAVLSIFRGALKFPTIYDIVFFISNLPILQILRICYYIDIFLNLYIYLLNRFIIKLLIIMKYSLYYICLKSSLL